MSPSTDGDVVAQVRTGDADTARTAVAAARRALPEWSRLPALARADLLGRVADVLTSRAEAIGYDLTREEGKTLSEAIGEVRRAGAVFRYFAGRAADPVGEVYGSAVVGTRIQTLRQPVGVVGTITPWNFPIAIPAWKIAPALCYGNTVVFKPATATPLTANALMEALVDAGLPDGVVNCVYVPGHAVTSAWVCRGGVDALSFTGSAAVGRDLHARSVPHNIKVQLELGGKNAAVVADDAALDLAADRIVVGAFASSGQKCTATARAIVVESVAADLVDAIRDRVARLIAGDPVEATTQLGPVIDQEAKARIAGVVDSAVVRGVRVIARSSVPSTGAFHPAMVVDHVQPNDPIATDEVFGPVLAILRARDMRHAVQMHNSVAQGLSGAVFTRSLGTAEEFVVAARAGIIHVNGETAGAEPHVPFGGMGDSSSWSREQGIAARDFFTQTKTIYYEGLPATGPFDITG